MKSNIYKFWTGGRNNSVRKWYPGEGPLGQPRNVRGNLGTGTGDARQIHSSIHVNRCVSSFGDETSKGG